MIRYIDGKVDLDVIEVVDIIDVNVLQSFLDNFALGMNCAAVSVDRNGAEITNPSYYRDFCQKYIHTTALGDSNCAKCHNEMGIKAVEMGKPYVGQCHAGLIDFAAPVIIKGHHIGTILGGQILNTEPDQNKIESVAETLGLDKEKLWEASQKIDYVSQRNIEAAAEVLYVVVNALARSGYQSLETKQLSSTLVDNFLQISQTVDVLANSAQNITSSQHDLGNEISDIDELSKQIGNILKAISNVANHTKLIGLNASIEAARLGNDGRGFAVVAKEIQKLSDNTTKTTSEISKLNKQIDEKITVTVNNSNSTLEITEDQSAAMEELSATVQNSVEIAEELKELFSVENI